MSPTPMGWYERHILPRLLDLALRDQRISPYRQRAVSAASGRVLEIGVGSGLNLPYYRDDAELIAVDPAPALLAMARRREAQSGARSILWLEGSAETIPLADRSVDAVVCTWTLCSIPDVGAALAELRRVLRPTGALHFAEHGRSPDPGVSRWQDRLTPLWRRLAGGCHLNRPMRELIEQSGFRIDRLDTGYIKGPRPMTYMYEGTARPT